MTGPDLPLVWLDGAILASGATHVSALDHGLLLGDGLFETLRVTGSRARFLARHIARLRRDADRLGIDPMVTDAELAAATETLISASGLHDARLRITLTSGPGPLAPARGSNSTMFLAIDLPPAPPSPARLVTVPWRRNERSALAGTKSTSWAENLQILRHVRSLDADDALLYDSREVLSECAAANLFIVIDDIVRTPALSSGCLPGVAREVLIERGLARESELTDEDLDVATEVFTTSSLVGARPVAMIDDRPIPVVDGDHTRRAAACLELAD
jgi:branched-chain amino acid aminotransferase